MSSSIPEIQSAHTTKTTSTVEAETGPLAIVGGCGHVGLPLGIAFAKQGIQVDLVDTHEQRVTQVNQGQLPFHEEHAEELLQSLVTTGRIKATTDQTALEDASAVIVTIGTGVDAYQDPTVAAFDASMRSLIERIRPGQLLILRSTIIPGLTDRLARQLSEMGRDDIDLAYCPERIAEGKSLEELEELPQLIGGVTQQAADRAASLFRLISPKMIFLKPVEAELSKLFCNAYRYISFAISNQFYLLAQSHGADFNRIHAAVKEDYPRMKSFAGAGLTAGPCLLKDTMQLRAFDHNSFLLGEAARLVNEGFPGALVENLKNIYPLKSMTVGILGMAFKPDSDDPRDSLSYKLRKVLTLECQQVLTSDPYVEDDSLVSTETVLEQAELILIGTPHSCYKELNFRQPVIDVTGIIGK